MSSDQLGQPSASMSTDSDSSTAAEAAAPAKRTRKPAVRKPKAAAAVVAEAAVAQAPAAEAPAEIAAAVEANIPAAAAPAVIEPAVEASAPAAPRTRKTLVRKPKVVAEAPVESPQLALAMAPAPLPPPESVPLASTPVVVVDAELPQTNAAEPTPVEAAPPAAVPSAPRQRVTLPHPIIHRVHPVALGRKRDALQYLLAQTPDQPTLIYTRTKHGADKIARHLERCGLKAAAIHGDKSGGARARALAGFKSGELQALVITDIAARMLDFTGLPRIIGYDLPHIPDDYVQRVLRTGSADQAGLSLTLITQEESPQYRGVRDLLSQLIDLSPLPGFEAPEPFDPERDPPQRTDGESGDGAPQGASAAAPAQAQGQGPQGDPRRENREGRNRRNRRDRHGRGEQRDRPEGEAMPNAAPALVPVEELVADAPMQPQRDERPRNDRPPKPERPRKEKVERAEKPEIGNRALPPPKPLPDYEEEDRPGPGNSLASPPPSQYDTGGFGRRGRRRDPFAPVVIGAEGEFNIYDERQPDDYRDQWSILGPDGGRPSWTYAQDGNVEEAPRRQFQGPPQGRRGGGGGGSSGGGGGGPRGAHRGPQQGRGGQQRHNRPRRADGR